MKTAERQLKKMHRRILVLLALLVATAFPAAAHNRTPLADLSPTVTWDEPLGPITADELPIVDAATIAAFDEAARIEIDLPADPLAELDADVDAIISPAETELLPIVSGLENRCSGFPVSLTEANLKETGELSLKLHWGRDHVRNRWYDPATGTWLTPDPMGYQDSSNLYAFCGNDPVNASDPRGEELTYAAWVGINTVVDTAIEYAVHSWVDVYNSRDTKFEWGKSFGTNLAINAITGGVGAKLKGLKYLKHLKNPVTRFLATEGAEYALDVAATGTVNVALNDQSAGEAYGSAAVGGILGRGFAHGLKGGWHGTRYLFDNYRVDWHPGFGTGFVRSVKSMSPKTFGATWFTRLGTN